MSEPAFLELRRQLIHGGVSPWRVRRLLEELRDHHAELVIEYQRAGSAHPIQDALARLGTEELLARKFLARPELLSWSRRWPWAVYVLAPLLLFPAAFVGAFCAMFPVIHFLHETAPELGLEVLQAIRFFCLYVLPVLTASGLALLAKRREVSSAWTWLAIGLVALLGALPNVQVSVHEIGAGIGFSTRPVFLGAFLVRWLTTVATAMMLCAATLYAVRRAQGPSM